MFLFQNKGWYKSITRLPSNDELIPSPPVVSMSAHYQYPVHVISPATSL